VPRRLRVKAKDLSKALSNVILGAKQQTRDNVNRYAASLPVRLQTAVLAFYPSVLKVRTGFLIGSIRAWKRTLSAPSRITVGVSAGAPYARFLEYGTRYITPRYFLRTPVEAEMTQILGEMKKLVSFKT